jgi:sigma-B regulation protein RsbU (phosphoserine phosphatase)
MIRLFLLLAMVVPLDDGWSYAVTQKDTLRPPAEEGAWHEDIDPRPDQDRWYRVPLPPDLPNDATLVFRSYVPLFELFVDDTRIYSFGDSQARGRLRLHRARLVRGRMLYAHIAAGADAPLFGGAPLIATNDDVPEALVRAVTDPLRSDGIDIVVGIVLIAAGLGSLIVAWVRRRASSGALLWFGIFAAMYGVRLIASSYLPRLLGASMREQDYAEAWITYLISAPAWMMGRRLIGDGWKSSLRWQTWLFALFGVLAVISDVVRGEPGTMERTNNILVVLGGLNILGNIFASRSWRKRELLSVMIGAVVFMAFALLNNFAGLGLLPFRQFDETPGFLVFVAALNYTTLRLFVRGEQERLALDGELATAREIQRSILPTSMPEIEGLCFAARYDPASSVAGDFYDFLVADPQHIGVIVADVAGHGVPAALIASMVKVAVSSNARFASEPATMLCELNEILRRDVRRNFVTATYLWLDMEQRTVSVSNGGHPSPVLIRDNVVRDLGTHGVLLGRFPVPKYHATTESLQDGDRIAAWTDGVVEARNARGEAFGDERLHSLLSGGASADAILDAVHRWRVSDDADDLTIVVIDVSSLPRTRAES